MLQLLKLPSILGTTLNTLGQKLAQQNLCCATAESCTAGLLAASITAIPGSSAWFTGGIIAYHNSVKIAQLHVPEQVLMEHGAVSAECVMHMAHGVCNQLRTSIGISISGIAGPSGGTEQKPVGTVWIGYCVKGVTSAKVFHFKGAREHVRSQAIVSAIQGCIERL